MSDVRGDFKLQELDEDVSHSISLIYVVMQIVYKLRQMHKKLFVLRVRALILEVAAGEWKATS